MTGSADIIVLGVGGIGSAAMQHLSRRGVRVLGIDQYSPGHDNGSSHGDSRAIRLLYFEHPDYVPLLQRAFTLWSELESSSPRQLYHNTGILQAGPADGEVIQGLLTAASAHDLSMNQMTAHEAKQAFPTFHFDDDMSVIFDPNGGLLKVEDCVTTMFNSAISDGAEFIGTSVKGWHSEPDHTVTVSTSEGEYRCQHLVICPGAWAPQLLPEFADHLQILRKSLFWFDDQSDCYGLDKNSPVFLYELGGHTFYGFPSLDDKGVKVADHENGIPMTNPDSLDRHVDTEELEAVTRFNHRFLPQLGHQLNHHATCMYTMAADGHFLIGKHPYAENVSMAAGLSGHGYKFATVLGEVLADIAIEGKTRLPVEFLSPSRFLGR